MFRSQTTGVAHFSFAMRVDFHSETRIQYSIFINLPEKNAFLNLINDLRIPLRCLYLLKTIKMH